MLGKILIVAVIVLAVLAAVGLWMMKRHPENTKKEDLIPENVADLNDRFNRARYQSGDGK